jgi:hypothetical protein
MSRGRLLPPIPAALALGILIAAAGMASAAPSSPGPGHDSDECVFPARSLRIAFADGGLVATGLGGAPEWTWRMASGMPRDAVVESLHCAAEEAEYHLQVFPTGEPGTVAFEFASSAPLVPKVSEDGRSVRFGGLPGRPQVTLRDLAAADAAGREVGARWERLESSPAGRTLLLILDAGDHLFPLDVTMRIAQPKASAATALRSSLPAASTAAPSNDACPGAEAVPGNGPFPAYSSLVDLTGATSGGDPVPACQPDVSHGVWFAFAPAMGGDYDFSICADQGTATTVEDTVLALYDLAAGCGSPGLVAGGCSDDTCGPGGLQSSLAGIPLAAGHPYALVAWIYGTVAPLPGQSDVQLRVDWVPPAAPPPVNDQCAAAEVIPPDGPFPWLSAITADISGATTMGDPPVPSCQPNVSRSIWYRFVPSASGRYAFSACADAPTATTVDDTVLALYAGSGACSGLQEMTGGCDDDGCAGEPAQSRTGPLTLAAGQPYDIVVWKYGASAPAPGGAAIQLRVEQVLAPANDACPAAAILPLERPTAGTTVAAADDTRLPAGAPCFAGPGQVASTAPGRDAAYRFTAPDDGRYSFRVTPSGGAGNLVVYAMPDCPEGGPPAVIAACLSAANRSATQPEELDCLPLDAGRSVDVIVDEDTTTAGLGFTIEATRCAPETEPNGTPATAGLLACFTEGGIVPAADADFFSLGIPAPQARVFAIVDGSAAGSADFDLRVTTASDTLEYDDFNNDTPFGSSAPNVAGTPLAGGPAWLRVSHYSPAAQSSPYRVCATVRPPAAQAQPETEPDDTPASATTGEDGYFSGALSAATDVDLFAFEASAGELIQIGLDLDPLRNATPWNGALSLLDAGGASLVVVNDVSSTASVQPGAGSLTAATPFSPGEALLYRVRTGGTFYARVAWSSGTPGDYLLSIARHPASVPSDGDGDGVFDPIDCAPADSDAWSLPGEATGVRWTGESTLTWQAPADAGGRSLRYDVLRSVRADDWSAALCLASGLTVNTGTDPALPAVSFYYLVRARNACGGNLGLRSDGTPRVAAACP